MNELTEPFLVRLERQVANLPIHSELEQTGFTGEYAVEFIFTREGGKLTKAFRKEGIKARLQNTS